MAGLNIWTTGKKGFQHAPLRLEALATFKIGVTFGNNTFVAVGGLSGKIVRSTDNGESFENANSAGVANNLFGAGFGNNTFVAVGVSGNIHRSTDNGSSFVNVTSPTSNQLRDVTFKE